MSKNRSRRIDRDTAEQLLGGAKVDSEAGQASLTGHVALAGLLAAVAAPAGEGELPGEQEAMAAFREARRNPAPQPRRRTMADTALARAFSAKALAAAFAVTAVGGVAVAAGTGHLPEAFGGGPDERAPVVAGPTGSVGATSSPSAEKGGSRSPDPRSSTEGGTARPSGGAALRPSTDGTAPGDGGTTATGPGGLPDLSQLCSSFTDRVAAGAKAHDVLADQSLQPLVKAAGGADKVSGYCAAEAKAKDGNGPTAHGSDKPTTTPTGNGRTVTPTPAPTDRNGGGKG